MIHADNGLAIKVLEKEMAALEVFTIKVKDRSESRHSAL